MEKEKKQSKKIYSEIIESDAYQVCQEVKTILNRLQMTSGINTDQCFDVKVILSELLQNAIKHGNTFDCQKKIRVDVWLQENSRVLGITVKDQGKGFDTLKTMDDRFTQIKEEFDPLNMDESGRGLFIVQNLCDCMESVSYTHL
ncbi:MAG: ATP-binding protein, partial [Clostridia bacterium]|nr:ATP-binding protein [Clostridia bacterium]